MSDYTSRIILILSLTTLLGYHSSASAQQYAAGNDIMTCIEQYGKAEVRIEYPGFDAMTRLAEVFEVSSCNGREAVLYLSSRTAAAFISRGIPYELIKTVSSKSTVMASSVAEAMEWNTYPTYTQYDSIVHSLADMYPDRCRLDTIGYSINGKVIFALKISDNVTTDEDEPEVFLSSSIHGDELCGFVLMLRLAELLVTNPSSDKLVNTITSETEVWINPLANPDGMYRNSDAIVYPVRYNNNNVDLNRNYPDPTAGSTTVQPENVAMIRFMKEHNFCLSVNFHSGAEVVNYPWDRWTRHHPDNDWFFDISRRYVDTVHLHSPAGYLDDQYYGQYPGVTNGATWYVITGGRQDYVTYSLGGREVTIELDVNKQTDAGQLEAMWSYNHRSLLRYISEALSGVRGRVTDASTGLPVEAEIFIQGHDTDSSQVHTDVNGNYIRLITPGTWDFTFQAAGYDSYMAGDVLVSPDNITYLNVQLNKKTVINDNTTVSPVPSAGDVSVMLPDDMAGDIIVTVSDISGRTVHQHRENFVPGIAVGHDFHDLARGVYIITVSNQNTGKKVSAKMVIVKESE